MFKINEDFTIECTRGDYCEFPVKAVINGKETVFNPGDVVRVKIFREKNCSTIVLQRDFTVEEETKEITISLTANIGKVINKPTNYWYEVELNPEGEKPHTIIGYDDDGAKIFKLYPEGDDVNAEDIEVVGKKSLQELVDYALNEAKESGAFKGEKGDKGDPGIPGSPGGSSGISIFGYKYADAEKRYDISGEDSTVVLYLFPSDGGYAAVVSDGGVTKGYSDSVSNKGAMKDYALILHAKGYKVTDEKREYAEYIKKINKVYIEQSVTSIGDYFMFGAHSLDEVVFEDSAKITRLGKYCFGVTQISGEYAFCNLDNNTTIDRSFYCCPKLEGITLGVSAKNGRKITVSENAFFGCINLRRFKIDDAVNTEVTLGEASFWYCANLEYIELQTFGATVEGFNFLVAPYGTALVRRQRVDVGNTNAGACTPLSGAIKNWGNYDENNPKTLSAVERWMRKNYYAYQELLTVKEGYTGKCHDLPIHTMDIQKKEEYLIDYPFPTKEDKAVFWSLSEYKYEGKDYTQAFRIPYYGSCWLFSYMHIWNVLHPTEQYASIEQFVEKLKKTKIPVDRELATAFEGWDYKKEVMEAGGYEKGHFDKDQEILATDLPQDINKSDEDTTVGETGTASWGVRKVLGWSGTRLTPTDPLTWAQIKRKTIDSILAGKPVLFECVGYTGDDNIGGAHAVAGIGYDASTDRFKIIDSTWGFPNVVPMEYWVTFEELLEPSEESAVWVFDSFDDAASINPVQGDSADVDIVNMALWATITSRKEYSYFFRNWTDAMFKPLGTLKPTTTGANEMFSQTKITNLATPLDGTKASLDLSSATQMWNTFASSAITSIPPINATKCTNMTCAFDKAKVTKLNISGIREDCIFDRTFRGCTALVNLTITGVIGQNGFNVSECPLSATSLANILDCLSSDGSGKTITLGSANKTTLTNAGHGSKITEAENKGWTVS